MLYATVLILAHNAIAASDGKDDIVVLSRELQDEAFSYTDKVKNEEQESDEPLARFSDAVCIGSAGLPEEASQKIVDRISEIALSLDLKIGSPGCSPNITIVFTDDVANAVRKLGRNRNRSIRSQSLASIQRIIDQPGSARAWTEVETKSRDGEKMLLAPNDPAILNINSQSRLVAPFRRDIVSATVLIEKNEIPDRSLRQIADYAAMRALTGARGVGMLGAKSILSTFTPDGDDKAPMEMTDFDQGYLRGLYTGNANILPTMKRQQIVRYMIRSSSKSVDDGAKANP